MSLCSLFSLYSHTLTPKSKLQKVINNKSFKSVHNKVFRMNTSFTGSSDPFGYSNQGENYDIFRPKYPKKIIDNITEFTKNKETYLDHCSGTGILFFELQNHFSSLRVLSDRSQHQLSVAEEKLKKEGNSQKTEIVCCDAYQLSEILKQRKIQVKFDLITFGQALHWFKGEEMLSYILNNLLKESPESCLAITGYFCTGFDYNYELAKSGQFRYDQYYKEVKEYFDCDREALDNSHSELNFENYFSTVKRENLFIEREITIQELEKYLKTYSAYNIYLDKVLKQNTNLQDPCEQMIKGVNQDLSYFFEKNPLTQRKEKDIILKMKFFLILLRDRKK